MYHHAEAERKFKEEWKRNLKFYRERGMTEEQIAEIYAFDRAVFNSDRYFYEHTVDLRNENENPVLSIEQDFENYTIETWLDVLDLELQKELLKLPKEHLKAFYLHRVYGYTQIQISSMLMKSQRTISSWISKIAEILKKFSKNF